MLVASGVSDVPVTRSWLRSRLRSSSATKHNPGPEAHNTTPRRFVICPSWFETKIDVRALPAAPRSDPTMLPMINKGVVQNRVTLETRNSFAGAALSIFGVTRNHHFLNHAAYTHRDAQQVTHDFGDAAAYQRQCDDQLAQPVLGDHQLE
jgi:hypothetical protein